MTAKTALLLAKVLKTRPEFWFNAQMAVDLCGSGTQIIRGGGEYVWRYRVVAAEGDSFEMVFEGGGNPTFSSQMGDEPRKFVMDDGHKKYAFAPAQ